MTHHVYTTKGVVLRQFSAREADRTAAILTRDLGLVYGSARGVKKSNSRLSSALLDHASVKVSLVRGKRAWRVTTVTLISDWASLLRGKRTKLQALARVSSLLMRLVRGEEKHAEFYDEFESSLSKLLEVNEGEEGDWELYTVSRLLAELGYLSRADIPSSIVLAPNERKRLLALVNDGIKQSGLT